MYMYIYILAMSICISSSGYSLARLGFARFDSCDVWFGVRRVDPRALAQVSPRYVGELDLCVPMMMIFLERLGPRRSQAAKVKGVKVERKKASGATRT